MRIARSVLTLVGPDSTPPSFGSAERPVVAITALLWAIACTALWGALVGVASHHAARDAALAPILFLCSALAALPFTLFVGRVFGTGAGTMNALVAYASGAFAGAAALLLLAPLVALYQHSSHLMASVVGPASAVIGLAFGAFVFARALGKLAEAPRSRRGSLVCLVLTVALQILALAQLASVMPPLFEHRTVAGHGIDAFSNAADAP